ncbi:MAG: hypothetical protein H7293_15420 [Candidatus Saccharibacteria bacterium]|nr:hypothetical protein [Rhodoferax sp.]
MKSSKGGRSHGSGGMLARQHHPKGAAPAQLGLDRDAPGMQLYCALDTSATFDSHSGTTAQATGLNCDFTVLQGTARVFRRRAFVC